ncbi:TPA: asparagine synthase (glutamine-hydrolyzing) [bacterium]|nr:asparagine synthase (glutamine-hydrolyzing) [bacterium]
MEVILHLYEDYGIDCVKQLSGMFAFAIFDEKKKRLFLARDRFGGKPLIYTRYHDTFIFASEIKSILENKDIPREIDHVAIHHYLSYGYIPNPFTIFKGIKKLPPASILVMENGEEKVERYWMPIYKPKLKISEDEACSEILRLLEESVRIRIKSNLPLGAFLSGGIDSSALVAMMASLMDQPVKTFSINFEEEDFSEIKFARIIANHFGCDHHELTVRPDAMNILPKLALFYNEPYADSSAIPTYYVSKMAKDYVKIVIGGDGGDELFGGYERYIAFKLSLLYDKIPRFMRDFVFSIFKNLPEQTSRNSLIRKAKRFLSAISEEPKRRYGRWMIQFKNEEKERLYSNEMKEITQGIDSIEILLSLYNVAPCDSLLEATNFTDFASYLPDDGIVKVEVATSYNFLAVKSPFLDNGLAEFAFLLPFDMKIRGTKTKYILKKALSNILPKEVLTRDKMGFGVPIGKWFRNEFKNYIYEVLLDDRAKKRGYFNMDEVKRILDEHTSGRKNYGYPIWTLLFLEVWHNAFID